MARGVAGPNGTYVYPLLAFMLVFAPLFQGGNRPLPLLVLEVIALGGLATLLWQRGVSSVSAVRSTTLSLGLGLLVVVPLLQLVPLPASWWSELPGHRPYFHALEFARDTAVADMRSLTIHARATEYSWLVILLCVSVFLMTLSQSRRSLRRLAVVFVMVAVAESILGIMQLGAERGSPLYLGNSSGGGASTGTYINRNHFAALMAMALPLSLALWFLETMPPRSLHAGEGRPTVRHSDRKMATQIVLSIPVLLLLVALLFSSSRAGIGSGFMVFAIASLALVWTAASNSAKVAFGMIGVAALAFAAWIGLTPVLERFAPDQLSIGYDGRIQIAAASFRAALDFLPFGSGLGTFADVFRRYQVEGLPGFVDHAHNDYAELFLELGVAGVAIVALLGAAYLKRWIRLARAWRSRSLGYLQVASGLGMLAMLVHAMFDFNFHIPANAIYFAFLAGCFFFNPDEYHAPEASEPPRHGSAPREAPPHR